MKAVRYPHWRAMRSCLPNVVTGRIRVSIALMIGLMSLTCWIPNESKANDPRSDSAESQSDDTIDFARQIQPIFARRCFKCHGPNESEGGLRLNERAAGLAELESGEHAIVPGDIDAGTLLDRIRGEGDGDAMPPEGKPLTDEEIELIEAWIKQGADWAEHWAFAKPVRREVPVVKNKSWVKNPIDAFILSRLEQAGLQPAAKADKVALIRRAYYDLTGLPPTLEEIDSFLADDSEQAYEQMLDRLLESEHYGEKWARHWLDLVRYAETNGYERDSRKDLIWKYRDYVIRAFNEDLPYDRFIVEQLAGDELADKDPDSIIATGFYRLGIWDDEPADRELARYDYLDDILRTTSEGFMGMTIGCARCHDHKIDPVSQKDYYSLLAFFSDISPHGAGNRNHVAVLPEAKRIAFEQLVAEKAKREAAWASELKSIEAELREKVSADYPDFDFDKPAALPKDGIVLADSIAKGQEWNYTFRRPADGWSDIAFDEKGWKKGPGGFGTRGTPGAVVRTEWKSSDIWLRNYFRLEAIPSKLVLKIHHDEDAEVYLNGHRIASFNGYVGEYKEVDVSGEALGVLQTGRNTLAVHCKQTGGGQYIDVGLTVNEVDPVARAMSEYGVELLGQEKADTWKRIRIELAASRANVPQPPNEFAMAVAEAGERKTWILGRGLPAMKGEEVGPLFPQILDPPTPTIDSSIEGSSGKRMALASWMVDRENPIVSRVMVNRIWQHHFGRGIVRSSSDMGYQGIPPTHPELLDWLAVEFMDRGWSVKQMHKLIMMSNAYQMSSEGREAALAQDPQNDLFWRFNMRRLSAEEIRDSILTVTGSLNPKMYGPSIFPPVSPEVLATASRPNAAWGKSSPEESNRRTIYVHVKRSLRPPMLANFDAPDTDTSCAVRMVTTVPTQALGMLNSAFMNEQAKKLVERLQASDLSQLDQRVALASRLTSGRISNADEIADDVTFIRSLMTEENLEESEALRIFCLMLLNTNEFVYLD